MIVASAAPSDLPGIMALEREFARARWSEASWADELAADDRDYDTRLLSVRASTTWVPMSPDADPRSTPSPSTKRGVPVHCQLPQSLPDPKPIIIGLRSEIDSSTTGRVSPSCKLA